MAARIAGEIGVTLADGTTHTFPVGRLPRHWKSWVMHQLPYGTNFQGCSWIKRSVAYDRVAAASREP